MGELVSGTGESASKIIIIGAGAAGLMAARELAGHYDVTVLEAEDQVGGRVRTLTSGASPHVMESGAEFVHGELPITMSLLNEAAIPYTQVTGRMYRVIDGKWEEEDEMLEGWDLLLPLMRSADEDMTMKALLDKYFSADKFRRFRLQVEGFVQGFDVADPSIASVKELYQEWSHDDLQNYRVNGGYGRLISYLENDAIKKGAEIHTKCRVDRISWSADQATVHARDNRSFHASKVIITVSVGVLRDTSGNAIVFTPEIPEYIEAASDIGFGNVIKVILRFKEPFWESQHPEAGFILTEESVPTWWTQYPGDDPSLTGWLGGPPSDAFINHSDDDLLQAALGSLSKITGLPVDVLGSMLTDTYICNWAKQTGFLGAYSFSTTRSAKAKELLNTPIHETLYFAGEALYDGPKGGTVEAAFHSGLILAEKVKASR
ncbi:flavin monoamine oxidase family protein [Flavihumibacter solisilvae]|uniref:Tryptophan 2-monooxygenase n=1 Tax=Flavihumibacter solisilvae TaxID=1349421 RepID=A0A0C1L875_9BACT|nr:NAD(P)/FAD-dependent oxidoreductase [Flavihumibacter solisilvae]KIC95811.1 hypothetical protein OI18_04020 [Flavihumibacter solisilvae]